MDLARITNGRTAELVRQGWTSRQQGDQDRLTFAGSTAAVDVARANVRVAQAQVDRLEELTRFESVTAPFEGVITGRNTDVGALINAGAGTRRQSCSTSPRPRRCASSSQCPRSTRQTCILAMWRR